MVAGLLGGDSVDGFLYIGNVVFQRPTVLHHQTIFLDLICPSHLFDDVGDLRVVHDMSEGKLFRHAHDIFFVGTLSGGKNLIV